MRSIHLHKAFLCLGSNEDAELRISEAFLALQDIGPIVTVSHVYESAAAPPSDEGAPAYLNAALCLTTELEPAPLKATLQALEHKLGRDRQSSSVAIDVDTPATASHDEQVLAGFVPEVAGRAVFAEELGAAQLQGHALSMARFSAARTG